MFLGHLAVGFAGRRLTPGVSLAAWIFAVLFIDLLWPFLLLAGVEHVRIAPGITAFTPLDFYDYPITHSLAAVTVWAVLVGGVWRWRGATWRAGALLAAGVLSHWILDALAHRPDLPVLPGGPFVGLELWRSVPATLIVELTAFAAAVAFYLSGLRHRGRPALWLLIAFVLAAYLGAAFGPPPPDVRTLAFSALALWLLIPLAWWADRTAP